jgi:hypothetical protein
LSHFATALGGSGYKGLLRSLETNTRERKKTAMLLILSVLMGRNLPFHIAVPPRLIVPNHILLVGIVFAFLLVRIAFVFFRWKVVCPGAHKPEHEEGGRLCSRANRDRNVSLSR